MGKTRKKGGGGGGGGAPEWMCTFSDMMSLLLCFFILLFAFSSVEQVKYTQAIGSIQGALGRIPGLHNNSFVKPISTTPQQVEPIQRVKTLNRAKEAIAKEVRSKIVADTASKDIVVEGVKEGISFSLSGRLLFEPGSAEIRTEAEPILLSIAETLNEFPELRICVEGHTDVSSIPDDSPFSNNWRLAQGRAYAVTVFLRDKARVREDRFSFASNAQFRPRFPNDTPENQALNRRVEIVLLQSDKAEVIAGVLEGSRDRKVNPEMGDFVPLGQ